MKALFSLNMRVIDPDRNRNINARYLVTTKYEPSRSVGPARPPRLRLC